MIVKGRDKPTANIVFHADGIAIRIDFALRLAGWVELFLDKQELEDLLTECEDIACEDITDEGPEDRIETFPSMDDLIQDLDAD